MTKDKLKEQLDALENSSAKSVPIEDVRKLVGAVRSLFEGDFEDADLRLYGELGDLARYINEVRKELRDFQPQSLANKELPEASDQLDAIVNTTEHATGQIMDACERLEQTHKWLKDRLMTHEPPLDPDVMIGVESALTESQANITNIFESCNFQDLTGQRIQKIVKALKEIERHVLRMITVFGLQHKEVDDETRKNLEEDAELLAGPGTPGKSSLEQDDIDLILDKLL